MTLAESERDAKLVCEKCGADFGRALIIALLIDAGARTSDPNICTDGGEHNWGKEER